MRHWQMWRLMTSTRNDLIQHYPLPSVVDISIGRAHYLYKELESQSFATPIFTAFAKGVNQSTSITMQEKLDWIFLYTLCILWQWTQSIRRIQINNQSFNRRLNKRRLWRLKYLSTLKSHFTIFRLLLSAKNQSKGAVFDCFFCPCSIFVSGLCVILAYDWGFIISHLHWNCVGTFLCMIQLSKRIFNT
jgi:hypothetical protein